MKTDATLLSAFSSTVTTLENLVVLADRLCERLRDEARADDPELRHIEEQLQAAREQLPKLTAYVTAFDRNVQLH